MGSPKEELKKLGISETKVAERAGISIAHCSRMLNGKGGFTVKKVQQLCDAIGGVVAEKFLVLILRKK